MKKLVALFLVTLLALSMASFTAAKAISRVMDSFPRSTKQ